MGRTQLDQVETMAVELEALKARGRCEGFKRLHNGSNSRVWNVGTPSLRKYYHIGWRRYRQQFSAYTS